MSDYTKSTNFASKDSLAIGNPLKIVKGTEIDTEFNNIATAVATKADIALTTSELALKAPLASPALTGTPTAPTAAVNTNTTQLATTAFVVAQIADDAPTKTGGGASGTWGISISGNAATATSATSATSATNAGTVTTVTTSQTLNATSGASVGGVGTYAFLSYEAGAGGEILSTGSTKSGSVLKYSGTNTIPSGSPSGTWRLMGYLSLESYSIGSSLWLRIS
jgi:hypothetical protein